MFYTCNTHTKHYTCITGVTQLAMYHFTLNMLKPSASSGGCGVLPCNFQLIFQSHFYWYKCNYH